MLYPTGDTIITWVLLAEEICKRTGVLEGRAETFRALQFQYEVANMSFLLCTGGVTGLLWGLLGRGMAAARSWLVCTKGRSSTMPPTGAHCS